MMLRAVATISVSVLLAPPLAAASFLILSDVFRFGLRTLDRFGDNLSLAITPYSWLIALLPALIAGVANAIALTVVRGEPLRLIAALPIGAVPFLLLLNWIAADQATGALDWKELAALGLSGALASLVSVAVVASFPRSRDAR